MKAFVTVGVLGLSVLLFLASGLTSSEKTSRSGPAKKTERKLKSAVFAGGCFWCTESTFEKMAGVEEVISGYMGGSKAHANYKLVSSGLTQHVEVVKVVYDPSRVTYQMLLNVFWRLIDPTDAGGSFVDRGKQYLSVIYYADLKEKSLADISVKRLNASGWFKKPVATKILPVKSFYPAEDYHQDYYKKNPSHYKRYRRGSGRDQFAESFWKNKPQLFKILAKPDEEYLKKNLTTLQYYVTRKDGTERPFKNEFWDSKKAGIYVDIVSGEALFSSKSKFKSGTGWPSFFQPLVKDNVVEKTDSSHGMVRVEVRSRFGDSHLGHVFNDGPKPTGLRYCINSASLRFIPADKLVEEGYPEFAEQFK